MRKSLPVKWHGEPRSNLSYFAGDHDLEDRVSEARGEYCKEGFSAQAHSRTTSTAECKKEAKDQSNFSSNQAPPRKLFVPREIVPSPETANWSILTKFVRSLWGAQSTELIAHYDADKTNPFHEHLICQKPTA